VDAGEGEKLLVAATGALQAGEAGGGVAAAVELVDDGHRIVTQRAVVLEVVALVAGAEVAPCVVDDLTSSMQFGLARLRGRLSRRRIARGARRAVGWVDKSVAQTAHVNSFKSFCQTGVVPACRYRIGGRRGVLEHDASEGPLGAAILSLALTAKAAPGLVAVRLGGCKPPALARTLGRYLRTRNHSPQAIDHAEQGAGAEFFDPMNNANE
jgi:hypothetical protein